LFCIQGGHVALYDLSLTLSYQCMLQSATIATDHVSQTINNLPRSY